MLDVLALSPHPDDVELCCGGTLAKMSAKGYRVGIIDFTKGELGTEGTADIRLREATEAAEILGMKLRKNLDFGDCRIGSGFDVAKRLAGVIRQYRPTLLIAPYGDAHHPDHAASRKLTDKAIFFATLTRVETSHEVHRIGMVAYYMLHKSFAPSFIVDVSQHYGKKVAAIKAYKSQMGLISGGDGLLHSITLRDQIYGLNVGVKHGEPFFRTAPFKIDDPVVFST
jgi:bacillithiol biosynthesis deacetylase BshB1